MKKLTILLATMACMAMSLTSCQKEENDGYIRFRATVEPINDGKYYFKPELGRLGTMTWGYDTDEGYESNYPIYIHSQTYFELQRHLNLESDYTGIYLLDADNSDDYNAQLVCDGGVQFTDQHAGTFWAFASSYSYSWLNSALRHTDELGTYMLGYFGVEKYIDAHDDNCANLWTDMEMVAQSYGSFYSQFYFKQIYGLLKINLTMPSNDYDIISLTISYDDTVTNQIPMSGDLGVNFDADGNPYTFISPGDNDYVYYSKFSFFYYGDNLDQHPNPQTFAIPLFPNNYRGLVFEFVIKDRDGQSYSATKTMAYGQTLPMQRAVINTLNLTLTEDDFVMIEDEDE